MIDLTTEKLIALADVPAILPKRRGGRAVHASCVYNWAQRGCRGICLEIVQVGGTKCTSPAALSRFFSALGGEQQQPAPRSPRQRERATAKAKKELAAAGW